MKAVILAAGMASRLRPLTLNTPKCLLKIGGKTILERTIENLIANSLTDIIIVTGFLSNKIKEFTEARFPFLKVQYINNPLFESTNNIYSLWLAKPALDHSGMILLDSDIVFDSKIIKQLLDSGRENCLALKKHSLSEEEIKVKIDSNSRILEIGKEVIIPEASGESVGIELFSAGMVNELFKAIGRKISIENRSDVFYESAFQQIINDGNSLYAIDISDYFCMEIDTPEDLSTANGLFEKN